MNKLFLIVFLAVCLVSVQAFVRRDAPAGETSDLAKQLAEISSRIQEALNPETLKKGLEDLVGKVNQTINDIKAANTKQA